LLIVRDLVVLFGADRRVAFFLLLRAITGS
jgi:hypothetical protein